MRMPNMRIKVFNFFGSMFPYAYFSGLTVDFILLPNLKMTHWTSFVYGASFSYCTKESEPTIPVWGKCIRSKV